MTKLHKAALFVGLLIVPPMAMSQDACVCVTDAITEANTGQIALSVTTPGGSGRYTSELGFEGSQTALMQSGIFDSTGFDAVFLGWTDLDALPNLTAADNAKAITEQSFATFKGALAVALAQVNHFAVEEQQFAKLELCNTQAGVGRSLLQAVQCGNEINIHNGQLEVVSQQLMATAILLEAVDHAERVNESAGAGGTNQGNQLHTAQLLPQQ